MITVINKHLLEGIYRPDKDSHKGQNGRLTIIGGSKLFHGASLWALKIASRIVDMVFYATVKDNKKLMEKLKSELYDFIGVSRNEIENYIEESDAVLIGPGLSRDIKNPKPQLKTQKLVEEEWEEDTYKITKHLLAKFPHKKWIIDAGSLQMMDIGWLKMLKQVIITPHKKEFERLFKTKLIKDPGLCEDRVFTLAKEYGCIIILKGRTDIVCSATQCVYNTTGNEGMTKGGTGDVLAGLVAALACKNDLFLAAVAGIYINGLAGDELYKKVGPYFNASDLCDQIPKTFWRLIRNRNQQKLRS